MIPLGLMMRSIDLKAVNLHNVKGLVVGGDNKEEDEPGAGGLRDDLETAVVPKVAGGNGMWEKVE